MILTLGISPCPNDTYAFAALLEGWVDSPPLQFVIEDVEQLNQHLARGDLDVSKASFHAWLHVMDRYDVLPAGAAMGFGVGPLLLAATADLATRLPQSGDRVLCPGAWTTAALLYRLFCPDGPAARHALFSDIMPALERGDADYGVVIHEGRFTYRQHDLHRVCDLGEKWEAQTRCPLPLGGILARRDLGQAVHGQLTDAIRRSLAFAREHPRRVLPVMARHAQEFSAAVLWEHVKLYVNDSTERFGEVEHQALRQLQEQARRVMP